jgi:hypothetical protein
MFAEWGSLHGLANPSNTSTATLPANRRYRLADGDTTAASLSFRPVRAQRK